MKSSVLALLIPCALLAACNQAPESSASDATPAVALQEEPAVSAQAVLAGASGNEAAGVLQLTAAQGGVSITGEITGLSHNAQHGFHVHEIGDCSAPDASSAGGHLNPAGAGHGNPQSPERHLGDMPNLTSDDAGKAVVSVTIPEATLHGGGPNDLVGRAVVVHAGRDDYVSQPAGDSGARIACGVVR